MNYCHANGADYLEEGLGFDDSIAELKVVPTDEIKQEEDDDDDEDDNEEEQDVKDEPMDSEGDITMDEEEIPPKTELQSPPTTLVRFPSPDHQSPRSELTHGSQAPA
jgi:hypothetical protein